MPLSFRSRLATLGVALGTCAILAACQPVPGTYTTTVTDKGGGVFDVDVNGPNGVPRGHGTVTFPPDSTTPPPAPTTTVPPPTTAPTTAPPTVPPTTAPTTAPPPPSDSAAVRFNWGTPDPVMSDEFNGTSVDATKWVQPGECWPANSTVKAGRCLSHNTIGGGTFRENGTADGKTGYLTATKGSRYGRTEIRMKVTTSGSGGKFHPVLLKWSDTLSWPSGGELDFAEFNVSDPTVHAFMHHPTSSGVIQDIYESGPIDTTQYHNYGLEWTPTTLVGFIDGVEWFRDTNASAQPPASMHQTIQLDNPVATSGMQPATMETDWAHFYALAA